ncbi:MAG: TIGR03936 family radical SAM-associated protein, partial [Candidatus Cloacimonetes bacterium]|nr:TIGR03936 family radical SAM-associated protein [Candidatus Cloacimonadota bacterium]
YVEEPVTPKFEVSQEEITNLPNYYYRVFYKQMNEMQFVSHLDIIRMIYNVLRASELPIVLTKGYNIHPLLRFGPPLPIGVQGRNEYFDLAMKDEFNPDHLLKALEKVMPEQLTLNEVSLITNKKMLVMEYYKFEQLTIIPPKELEKQFEKYTNAFLESSEFKFTRIRKGKEKISDLKEIIKEIQWDGSKLEIIKKIVGASIFDVLREVYQIEREETNNFVIIRNRLLEETQ